MLYVWNHDISNSINLPNHRFYSGANLYLSGNQSHIIDNYLLLYPDEFSFGPYVALEKGNYYTDLDGDNLDEIEISLSNGGKLLQIDSVVHDEGKVRIFFKLNEDVSELEILLKNNTHNIIKINSLIIETEE